jgi:hypothetical protein
MTDITLHHISEQVLSSVRVPVREEFIRVLCTSVSAGACVCVCVRVCVCVCVCVVVVDITSLTATLFFTYANVP